MGSYGENTLSGVATQFCISWLKAKSCISACTITVHSMAYIIHLLHPLLLNTKIYYTQGGEAEGRVEYSPPRV